MTQAPSLHSAPSQPSRWWLLLIPIAFMAIRCIYAPLVELFADEAYYWVWSRQLALGYFDHPPMVAWLIHLSTLLFGTHEFTIRLPAILLAGGSIYAATWLASSLGASARTLLLVQVMLLCFPMLHVMGAVITPDTPALFFTLLATAAAVRCQTSPAQLRWWLLLGIASGLAMLSKYTALLPVAVMFSYLLISQRRRWYLPIFAGIVAIIVLSPLLIWNYQNDWISFRFQLGHGLGRDKRTLLMNVGDYIGAQFLVATPLLLPLMLWAGYRALRGASSAARLVALASLIPLAFFLYGSLRHKVEANWPTLSWIPLLVLLAMILPAASQDLRRFSRTAITVSAVFSFVLLLPPALLARLNKHSPSAKAGGMALLINDIRQMTGTLPIVCTSYQDAALFSYYLPHRPHIPILHEVRDRPSQYDVWPLPILAPGQQFILIIDYPPKPGPMLLALGDARIPVEVIRATPYQVMLDGFQKRDRVAVLCAMPSRDEPATRRYSATQP